MDNSDPVITSIVTELTEGKGPTLPQLSIIAWYATDYYFHDLLSKSTIVPDTYQHARLIILAMRKHITNKTVTHRDYNNKRYMKIYDHLVHKYIKGA